jgi:hypothetical protein
MDLLTELKHRSGIEDNPDQEGLDLFAELIIQECLKAVDALDATSEAGDSIVEHFGLR